MQVLNNGLPHHLLSPYQPIFKEEPSAGNGYQDTCGSWQNQNRGPRTTESDRTSYSTTPNQTTSTMTLYPNQPLATIEPTNMSTRGPVRADIATANLENPSDALEILAHLADRVEGGSPESGLTSRDPINYAPSSNSWQSVASPSKFDHGISYKPFKDGRISEDMVYKLFKTSVGSIKPKIFQANLAKRFEECYHPFFPIVRRDTFVIDRIPWLSRAEPHLFSAILTIASKDNEVVHQFCYDHMQDLLSLILAGADADIEAVEALLLLSQWVSHRPQTEITVGRGEEDRVAWMFIGIALRLGYFLGLDRTSFKGDTNEDATKFVRKRLVWTACYVCDRSVSVRLGKGFWARGPGPLSGLNYSDFPSLQPTPADKDDWSKIFQANLELTQIFGNVYDILYSSKTHGWKQMLEGRYAKYLDDFRTSIRNWKDTWGTLPCEWFSNTSDPTTAILQSIILTLITRFFAAKRKSRSHLRVPPSLRQRIRISSHNFSRDQPRTRDRKTVYVHYHRFQPGC
jgi:hypothetical protein